MTDDSDEDVGYEDESKNTDIGSSKQVKSNEKVSKDRIETSKFLDIKTALSVNDLLCNEMNITIGILNNTIDQAKSIVLSVNKNKSNNINNILSDLFITKRNLKLIVSKVLEESEMIKDREVKYINECKTLHSRLDSVMSSINKTLYLALILNKISSSRFNIGNMLNKRLGVNSLINTLLTAKFQISKSISHSKSMISSNGNILIDFVNDIGPDFQ